MLQWTQECLCSFKLVFWVPLYISPGMGLLRQMEDPFSIFWGMAILLSTVAEPVCIPTNSAKGFPFLHKLTSTCFLIYWWWPFWQVSDSISLQFLFAFLWRLVMLSIFSYVYWPSVHLHNGILLSCEKEVNLTLCDRMNGPEEHFAKWSKSVRERQAPYDLTHMWNLMNKLN